MKPKTARAFYYAQTCDGDSVKSWEQLPASDKYWWHKAYDKASENEVTDPTSMVIPESDKVCGECGHSPGDHFAGCDVHYRNQLQAAEPTADLVNEPPHYRAHPSGVECITITEHMGFNLGNAVKYIWRADEKGAAIEDLRKAAWYVNREIERRERAS